jgi:hypothetical protein
MGLSLASLADIMENGAARTASGICRRENSPVCLRMEVRRHALHIDELEAAAPVAMLTTDG